MSEKNIYISIEPTFEKVKAIYKLMTENLDKHYTLEWLANEYDISLTQMKSCFKEGLRCADIFIYAGI